MDPLLTVLAVLVIVLCIVSLLVWSRLKQTEQQLQSLRTNIVRSNNDIRSIVRAALNVGERVGDIEAKIELIDKAQNNLKREAVKNNQDDNASGSGYEQALKLAAKGISSDELADICHISKGEAELINMMHRHNNE